MITIKNSEELQIMKRGGLILSKIIYILKEATRPGIKTKDLGILAAKLIFKNKAKPSFKNYKPNFKNKSYPGVLCISLNDEVVHGIAGNRVIKCGDLISLDLGIKYKGLHTDMAITFGVEKISKKHQRLIDVTKKALKSAAKFAKEGNRIGDISWAIKTTIERDGFSPIRDCMGHGIGFQVHEDPDVPNYGERFTGYMLKAGMTLALEPMASEGSWQVYEANDGWTIKTLDRSFCSHFEQTIAISGNKPIILTPFE